MLVIRKWNKKITIPWRSLYGIVNILKKQIETAYKYDKNEQDDKKAYHGPK
jgi:hypothetical protein